MIDSGNIDIKRYSDDVVLDTIDITAGGSLSTTTITNDTLTIQTNATLANGVQYYVTIDVGAVEGTTGGDYAGITSKNDWTFTTGNYPTAPGPVERCTRFGFHKINSNYTGSCMEVCQNSNGTGAASNIGWQTDGYVDKTAIEAFRTTYGTVFLKKLYDQNEERAISKDNLMD